MLGEYADVDQSRYLTINPDDVKERMAARGLLPDLEGLSPMEASALAHEESSHVANRLAERVYGERKNVIWDITMSSPGSVEKRIDAMREAGYERIDSVFVDIPVETSVERSMGRHRRGSRNRATFEGLKDCFDSWRLFDNSRPGEPPQLIDGSEQQREEDGP